jgi:hypothetical protein
MFKAYFRLQCVGDIGARDGREWVIGCHPRPLAYGARHRLPDVEHINRCR